MRMLLGLRHLQSFLPLEVAIHRSWRLGYGHLVGVLDELVPFIKHKGDALRCWLRTWELVHSCCPASADSVSSLLVMREFSEQGSGGSCFVASGDSKTGLRRTGEPWSECQPSIHPSSHMSIPRASRGQRRQQACAEAQQDFSSQPPE